MFAGNKFYFYGLFYGNVYGIFDGYGLGLGQVWLWVRTSTGEEMARSRLEMECSEAIASIDCIQGIY